MAKAVGRYENIVTGEFRACNARMARACEKKAGRRAKTEDRRKGGFRDDANGDDYSSFAIRIETRSARRGAAVN